MTGPSLRPTWAEINLSNFRANLETVCRLVPPKTGVLAVVKANGYGIGAVAASRAALSVPKVAGLAVATPDEAVELRNDGIGGLVLVLGPVTPEGAEAMARQDVSVTVANPQAVHDVRRAARTVGKRIRVHLKIETGMGRIGMRPGAELSEALSALADAPEVTVEGVFTHFAASDTDREYTALQMDAFEDAIRQIEAAGIRPRYRHAANSAAILSFPRAHLDLVRPGIVLYGSYPDPSLSGVAPVLPVLSLLSRVSHVKRVPSGYSVGYGRTYVTAAATTIATVPIGYADGYPRLLSGKGAVLIHGRRFPLAGRVCMDQIMVDVGDEDVQAGDLVTLIGVQGGETITVDEVAALSGTIAHEILTGIGPRVPRVYV